MLVKKRELKLQKIKKELYLYTRYESVVGCAVILDPPQVAVLGDGKGLSKTMKNRPLELPMSPGSPSQLSLSESEPYYRY